MEDLTVLDSSMHAGEGEPVAVWRAGFLAALGCNGNASEAARAVGITRQWAYQCRLTRPDFKEEWDAALEIASDVLEREAWRRAVEGGRTYKFDKKGNPLLFPEGHPQAGKPYYEMVYSDTLLTLLLKANRPDKFKERTAVETTDKTPPPVYDLTKLSLQEKQQLLALSRKALPSGEANNS